MFAFNTRWPDVRVGDVFFVIGYGTPSKKDLRDIEHAEWYKALPKRFDTLPPDLNLPDIYQEHCYRNDAEPSWITQVPDQVRQELRRSWLAGDYFDPLAIYFGHRESLGFTFAIQDEGLIHEVDSALSMFRLGYVRQLGFLHDPAINEVAGVKGMAERFMHTRYAHSIIVLAIASLLARKVKLSKYDLKHLQVAAFTHDVLTPAGGDSVKPIDFAAFDEDAHYPEVFQNNPEWNEVREQYGLDEKLLASIVRGEGVLGQLLDLADKSAYVAHDMDAYLKDIDPKAYKHFTPPEGIVATWNLKEAFGPGICALWECVEIINGQVVITDNKKLAGFLELRALLFRHLYYNPRSRYREHLLAVLVIEPLYQEGTITRKMLLSMSDDRLDAFLNEITGNISLQNQLSYTETAPVVETFATEKEALERIRRLVQKNSRQLFMIENIPRVSIKAVQYLVRDPDGNVCSFADTYPKEAEAIMAIDDDPKPVKLYILSPEKLKDILPEWLLEKLYARQCVQFGLE